MKNLIFIINALFVMATSTLLFSCGGDDDPVPQKEEETPIVNVPFYTAALDSQLLFLDQKYEFVIDGVAKTLTFSDMTMSNESAVKENIDKAFRILDGTKVRPQYSIYKAIFPVKKGHTVTFVGYAYSAKSNIPENVELVNVLLYYQCEFCNLL